MRSEAEPPEAPGARDAAAVVCRDLLDVEAPGRRASNDARWASGKSPASVNNISALPAGVVLIQRRVSQSVRVMADKRLVMLRRSSTGITSPTLVVLEAVSSGSRREGHRERLPELAVGIVFPDSAKAGDAVHIFLGRRNLHEFDRWGVRHFGVLLATPPLCVF
jgi:hypothetical protein